jgi:hypothetical protein
MQFARNVLPAVCLILVIATLSCSDGHVVLEPTPGPPLHEGTPAEFEYFSDPEGDFSIRIPSSWTIDQEKTQRFNDDYEAAIDSSFTARSDTDLSLPTNEDLFNSTHRFAAGFDDGTGLMPNVWVTYFEIWPGNAESGATEIRKQYSAAPSYESSEATDYSIGLGAGNGLIFTYSMNNADLFGPEYDNVSTVKNLISTGLSNGGAWVVKCTVDEYTHFFYDGAFTDCTHVLHSFRLLR